MILNFRTRNLTPSTATENNRSAAGLRRSAVAERIRLREEWSALKGTDTETTNDKQNKNKNVLRTQNKKCNQSNAAKKLVTSNVLQGVVALVEVGAESRALALRAALGAMGATVVPTWSAFVTHVVWSEGGCRPTRAKARALACCLVSPLWVEACAASNRRFPEKAFPAAARASDLPSPRTLRCMLKKAEMENLTLPDLLHDSKDDDDSNSIRLRISSENEQGTSTDKSTDISHDTSKDKSHNSTGVESRVNTAPQRHLLDESNKHQAAKSRRKLFTHKEAEELDQLSEKDDAAKSVNPKLKSPRLTQRDRRDLARAERMARKLVAASTPSKHTQKQPHTITHRIVLTGMSRSEREIIYNAIRTLNGKVQNRVNKRTTHVLLGSCREDRSDNSSSSRNRTRNNNDSSRVQNGEGNGVISKEERTQKARTLNALLGAARGCRVLYGKWAIDSLVAKKWLHHQEYVVPHLRKISQKARVERAALRRVQSEYAYDVFYGMRVKISPFAEQKDAAIQLLTLCGATVLHTTEKCGQIQNGRLLQDGGHGTADFDITIGVEDGEVCSKWVFDSVAAARMRTTRRYVNRTGNDVTKHKNR